MSSLFSISLFYASFFPLWIVIIFLDIKNIFVSDINLWTEKISVVVIFILSIISMYIIYSNLISCKNNTHDFTVIEAKEEKFIVTEYVLSYVLPVVSFDFTKWDGVLLFLIIFGILGWQSVKHNCFCVNIFMDFLNFRIYNCKLKNNDNIEIEKMVVSKRKMTTKKGEKVKLSPINNDYQIDIQN